MKALTYAPLGLLAATLVWNCSDSSSTPVVAGGADASPDGYVAATDAAATDAGSDAHELPPPPPPPAGCKDAAKGPDPKDDACWVSPAFGVFVAPTGVDATAKGTQAAPFATLGAALAALKSNPSADRTRMFVCADSFTEPTIELIEGVVVYGYFDCGATDTEGRWKVAPDKHAHVTSSSPTALHAKNIVKATRIDSVDFTAADAVSAGASSYGLIAEASSGLTFVASRIEAGVGARGERSSGAQQLTDSGAAKNGAANRAARSCPTRVVQGSNITICPTDYATASNGGTNACVGAGGIAPGAGGGGGVASAVIWTLRSPDQPETFARGDAFVTYGNATRTDGQATVSTPATAHGATYNVLSGAGTYAVSGAAGIDGAAGSNGVAFALTANGFVPADGLPGTNGAPGQAGGGGAGAPPNAGNPEPDEGTRWVGSTGAGGGAGGCPGVAGGAGKGGGASIGVLAINSKIVFTNTLVSAQRGGVGATGSPGGKRTPGGLAGTLGPNDSMYSAGGSGGAGGRAGYSGSGGSGPSFGIAWTGQKPLLQGSSALDVAAPASGRDSSSNDDGVTVPATAPGASEAIHAF